MCFCLLVVLVSLVSLGTLNWAQVDVVPYVGLDISEWGDVKSTLTNGKLTNWQFQKDTQQPKTGACV